MPIVERAGGRSPTCCAYTSFIPREVGEIDEEDRRLQEVVETAPRRFEDRGEVPHDLLGLLLHGRPGELARLERDPELTRDEHEVTDADRLVVRGALEGPGRAIRPNDLLLRHVCLLVGRSGVGAGSRERDAERLEDRLEHVLRVLALDQPHVDRQARGLGETVGGRPPRDRSAAHPRGSRSGRRSRRRAAFPDASTTTIASASSAGTIPNPRPCRPLPRAAGGARLRARPRPCPPRPRARRARSRAGARSLPSRRARRAGGRARRRRSRCCSLPRRERDPSRAVLRHSSVRSIDAPSAWSRSSIRS